MTTFENWYLRRFTPVEDGFTFTQWGYDVHLSRAEVAELLAEWRRVWLSPYIWGGWLLLGVALPTLLYVRGSSVPAFMVALLFGVIMAVTLAHTHYQVNAIAQMRVPLDAARAHRAKMKQWPGSLAFIALGSLFFTRSEGWLAALWLALVAIHGWIVVREVWRWRRSKAAPQPSQ